MSLNAFKEALKPCKHTSSSSSSYNFSAFPSQISHEFDSSITTRKPPKSSLSRQLLSLQDDIDIPLLSINRGGNLNSGSEKDGEEEKEEKENAVKDIKLESFNHTGPYEPLVLSLPGEIPVVQVPASINSRLLDHQRVGVKFLYKLYRNNHGGVLGDDMGLGKTIQAIAFLSAVFSKGSDPNSPPHKLKQKTDKKGPVLIICPSSVILNWESEFSKWSTFSVSVYHGANRDLILDKLAANGVEILITSFDTYRLQDTVLSNIPWDIVIVDEAHRLKNEKSKLYTACLMIKTLKRYGLTGTMMQNKIMELFNLFDWVVPGGLGTREHFREFYDEPLKHGQRSTAPERFVQIAEQRKQHLVSVLQKYMLRRTKEETIGHLMMGKEDNAVFCAMSEVQKRVYQRTLQLPDIQCLVNKDRPCGCGSPLKQVECCNRIVPDGIIWRYLHRDHPEGCDSCPFCLVLPCLVKLQQLSNHLELIKPNPKDDPDKQRKDAEFASAVFGSDIDLVGGNTQNDSFMGVSDVRHCGKMRALDKLMHSWISMGDKILLFSYSVSANRVVLFDPNWNPAQDLQAQDRSFRYGQKRHVTVFRLLAAGSLEELVYTRQVYKQQLSNIAVAGKMERRYFEGVQDCKEFKGELFGICNLFRDLSHELFTSEIVEPNLSVVYAHRNEDIVNAGSGAVVDGKPRVHVNDEVKQPCPLPAAEETKESDAADIAVGPKEINSQVSDSSKRQKNDDCSLLALLMGMEEFELNKLLHSEPQEMVNPNG
ncbi:switch 2 [Phtheirospermum japonicum]|uniref:Switch 2 n=1 Tax=Phtheirospermum japonicum TaxID=374723 RepID=A0A830AXN8_9LAMI|nr:switch 2 [Phtheirospermum japonicum]